MVYLTIKDLLKRRRDIPVPFSMRIKKGITEETIEIKTVLRVVPGKRLTALCLWRKKEVVVKIFFHPMRWEKNQSRDLLGTSLLLERGLATPLILNDTVTADRKAALIIMEYLKDGNTLNYINREIKNKNDTYLAIEKAVLLIGECHKKGVWQPDIHLDNFYFYRNEIYLLDGGDVKSVAGPLKDSYALTNLALFFAQFDVDFDINISSLLNKYEEKAGPISESARSTFPLGIKKARIKRLEKLWGKVFRSTTSNRIIKTSDRFAVCDRKLREKECKNIFLGADKYMDEGAALKAGNASTVAEVTLNNADYVLKRYNLKSTWRSVKYAFRSSRASRSWRNALALNMIGINTPHPCLFFEERILWHFRSRAFFLSENIKALNLLDYMNSRVLKDAEITLIIDAFKRLFKLMIYYKISHGDMKATNFILHENKLFVLDLDSMSRHRNPYFFRRAIQKDLDRFLKNWTGGKYESEFERLVASIEFPV